MKELTLIQTALKVPKKQFNKFGNYNYRDAEDILEAVKPLLQKYNCELYISDEVVFIEGRFYLQAKATFRNADGDTICVTGFAREEADKKGMDGSQVTGASSSYARKYALNGLFLIDDTKDSDSTNDGTTPAKASASKANTIQANTDVDIEKYREELKLLNTYEEVNEFWKQNAEYHKNEKFKLIFKTRLDEIKAATKAK